jgi:gamma-tubulin complex component 2
LYSTYDFVDPSLRHLVEQILPIATYYLSIDAFIERFSRFPYGTVNHALCSAIRVFIEKYLTFIAQLEHEFQTSSGFTLQKLWFYAQDTLRNLKILHQLATCIRSVKKVVSDDEDDFEAVLEGLKKEDATEEQVPDNQKGGAVLNILSDRLVGLSG